MLAADRKEEFVFRIKIMIDPEIQLIAVYLDCSRKWRLRAALSLRKLVVRRVQTVTGRPVVRHRHARHQRGHVAGRIKRRPVRIASEDVERQWRRRLAVEYRIA